LLEHSVLDARSPHLHVLVEHLAGLVSSDAVYVVGLSAGDHLGDLDAGFGGGGEGVLELSGEGVREG